MVLPSMDLVRRGFEHVVLADACLLILIDAGRSLLLNLDLERINAGILMDPELGELHHGGRGARWLRHTRGECWGSPKSKHP